MELHWSDHLLFLILGVIIPLRTVMGKQPQLSEITFDTRTKLQLYWGNNAWLWLMCGVVAGVWWLNDRPWQLIGLDWPFFWPSGWPLAAVLLFAALYLWDTFSEVSSQVQRDTTVEHFRSELGFLPQTSYEYAHYIFLALTAGVCEEFIFRGYFIRYLQAVLANDTTATLAILVAAVIFGVVHLYQGWQAVIKIGGMAVIFGYIFVHTGSLWLLMAIHFAVDLIGGFIAWRLLAKDRA